MNSKYNEIIYSGYFYFQRETILASNLSKSTLCGYWIKEHIAFTLLSDMRGNYSNNANYLLKHGRVLFHARSCLLTQLIIFLMAIL